MNFFELKGPLEAILSLLKKIKTDINCLKCASGQGSLGTECTLTGDGDDVPEGLSSFSIVKLNDTGTVNVEFGNGSVYNLAAQGEGFNQDASPGWSLPSYGITSEDGGEWRWIGLGPEGLCE